MDSLAQRAAESWVMLTDSAKYAESYEQAAEQMRALISKDNWAEAMTIKRTPLGSSLSRRLRSAKHSTTLKAAPGYEGITLEYESSFQNKNEVTEVFLTILQKDGQWQVCGYFIK
jgi:hypothetical protein